LVTLDALLAFTELDDGLIDFGVMAALLILGQKVPAEANCCSFAMFWTYHSLAVYYYSCILPTSKRGTTRF
jgi:hypothetical protein